MINYSVCRIDTNPAKEYIHEFHYSHGSHNRPSPCYGLFDGDNLIGVCMFATPCSERVRAKLFGEEYKSNVTELHRLHIQDGTPKNTESWFISRCLKLLREQKPIIKVVISFSDSTYNHVGTIYRATNAYYYGMSSEAIFYEDETGRLRHKRQCGINITIEDAKTRGWIPKKMKSKYRYFWLLVGRLERKTWLSRLKVDILEYPKNVSSIP